MIVQCLYTFAAFQLSYGWPSSVFYLFVLPRSLWLSQSTLSFYLNYVPTCYVFNGPNPTSFCLFSFFSQCKDKYNTNLTIKYSSVDSGLWSRTWGGIIEVRRQIHWAMVASYLFVSPIFSLRSIFTFSLCLSVSFLSVLSSG